MVKTSPSNAGVAGSIPGWGTKIPHASQPKNQNIKNKKTKNKNRSNIETNSIKDFLKNQKRRKMCTFTYLNLIN